MNARNIYLTIVNTVENTFGAISCFLCLGKLFFDFSIENLCQELNCVYVKMANEVG